MAIKDILLRDNIMTIMTGLVQGLIMLLLVKLKADDLYLMITLSFVNSFTLILLFSYKKDYWQNTILASGIFATVLSGVTYICYNTQQSSSMGVLICANAVILYIAIPFIQIWVKKRSRIFPYQQLFLHSWSNIFIGIISGILLGSFWLVIFLWVELFQILNITVFQDIFYNQNFFIPSICTIFALGVHIGRSKEKVVNSLRSIIISLCRILLPIIVVISILFLISLAFVGTDPLFQTKMTSSIISWLILALLFLINGIFQDGTEKQPLQIFLKQLTNLSLITLPIYSSIAFYSLYLRIDQYGLTPDRFLALIMLTILSLYSFGYAYATIIKSDIWLEKIKIINVRIAVMIAGIMLLICTPILYPEKYSAMNQYNRLISGKIDADSFDYNYLQNSLGSYGKEYMKKIRKLEDHKQIEVIKSEIAMLDRKSKYPTGKIQELDLDRYQVTTIPNDTQVTDGLLEFLQINPHTKLPCYTTSCFVIFINLDTDLADEVIFINKDNTYQAILIDQDENNQWFFVKKMQRQSWIDFSILKQALDKENYKAIEQPYKSLQIENAVWKY